MMISQISSKLLLVVLSLLLLFPASIIASPKNRKRLKKPVIIVDPGHGGKDPGTLGRVKKTKEKDVVLSLSKKLTGALSKKTGGQVFITRTKDEFITLDHRDNLANWRKCDLFLSVHANASKNRKAEGIEIYYLNRATDSASRKLAARENSASRRKKSAFEAIVSDLIQTAATEDSAELAQHVRRSTQKRMKRFGVKDVKVKTALFYVLVGAKCPSLLIESGFLSNRNEEKLLRRADYQRALANAIAEGVQSYLQSASQSRSNL